MNSESAHGGDSNLNSQRWNLVLKSCFSTCFWILNTSTVNCFATQNFKDNFKNLSILCEVLKQVCTHACEFTTVAVTESKEILSFGCSKMIDGYDKDGNGYKHHQLSRWRSWSPRSVPKFKFSQSSLSTSDLTDWFWRFILFAY